MLWFSGSHPFYKTHSVVKIRETQGLAIPGAPVKQYHLLHPSQNEYGSQFSPPNEILQYYNHLQFSPKPTSQSGHHFPAENDDYTRNLLPPPYKPHQDKNKTKVKPVTKPTFVPTESTTPINNVRFNENIQHSKYTPQSIDVQAPLQSEVHNFNFNHKPTKEKTVELQVTKEKLQAFHNTVPPNFNFQPDFADFNNYRTINKPNDTPPPAPAKVQTYEVTEGKFWQEAPNLYRQQQFSTSFPNIQSNHRRPSLTELQPPTQEFADIPFLPTPFKPENIVPTSPTQSEVSTIFTKLSLKQKSQATTDSSLYDIKEVSTHYPILGNPLIEVETPVSSEVPVEATTVRQDVETNQPTDVPVVVKQRLDKRRRRPGYRLRTTTEESVSATDNYEFEKNIETVNNAVSRRPLRRRPIRYRTTTVTSVEESPKQNINQQIYRKVQRLRIQTTEAPISEETGNSNSESETSKPESSEQATERTDDDNNSIQKKQNLDHEFHRPTIYEGNSGVSDAYEGYAVQKTTTEQALTISEDESFETERAPNEEAITMREIYKDIANKDEAEETTLATTTIVTSTTTETAVSKPQVLRRRPIKYDTNRPRFSVKEFRQRLNQHSSTTTTTSTEIPKASTESSRTRYSNRFRRPTTAATQRNDETTESTRARQRYSGKDSVNASIIIDKPVKAVNTRLRPFGRYRSTTEATTTQKVSIRPNIFNSLRRPTPISLRKRIHNKLKNNTEELPTTTTETVLNTLEDNNDAELSETIETSVPYANNINADESSTEFDSKRIIENEDFDSDSKTTITNDIMRSDSILQRVSDLTSSAKDTPGLFKSVAPISRRVPSYFTIATDDPILPIETVFANIKDKSRN